MKKNVFYLLLGFFALFLTTACSDDDSQFKAPKYRMAIFNEGNFQAGNASISLITPENEVVNNVFQQVNNRPLGDVAQSAIISNNKLYVTLNNSAKVEVMDPVSFLSMATILDGDKTAKPIYMQPLNNEQAIVSDYGNSFMLVNTTTNAIVKKVDVKTATKQMVGSEGKVFIVANNNLLVIDANNPENPRTIAITSTDESWFNARLVKDKQGNVWMLTSYAITCVDAKTETIVKELKFEGNGIVSSSWPQSQLDINKAGDQLFLMATENGKSAIFKIGINDTALPTSALFELPASVQTPYNMAISPEGTVVVCDALDYKQSGIVYEYDQSGAELNKWIAGINPQFILFSNK